ncbi:MAG: hypothetical protein WA384_11180, partial [Rhodomicrobium sp.]
MRSWTRMGVQPRSKQGPAELAAASPVHATAIPEERIAAKPIAASIAAADSKGDRMFLHARYITPSTG